MPTDEGSLESFVDEVCKDSHLRVEADLGDGFVRLRSDEAERRQAAQDIRSTEDIVIELLRNSRDAHASNIFLAVTRDEKTRRLVAIDDGEGIPPRMHEQIFEARVTSKLDTMHMDKWGVHGRGMALYSVAANATTARVAASDVDKGCSVLVETDLDRLGEKADQSTFPSFELGEDGSVMVRGPRNILRTACEFAIDSHKECTLYLGSATDVAATLYAFGLSSLSASTRAFCTDSSALPVPKRLSVAPDPAALAQEAAAIGLDISERSARRIMDGQIAPLGPLIDRVRIKGMPDDKKSAAGAAKRRPPCEKELLADDRGLKVHPDDLQLFASRVSQAYSELARSYYLEDEVDVDVKVGKDAIRVTIPIERIR